jgi:hypothetical protein
MFRYMRAVSYGRAGYGIIANVSPETPNSYQPEQINDCKLWILVVIWRMYLCSQRRQKERDKNSFCMER